MFGSKRITMEKLKSIRPTSKVSLKMSCLMMTDGDLDKAERMYDFFAKDMELPDNEPTQPTIMEQVKSTASSLYAFYKENQDDIAQGIAFIRSIRGGAPAAAPTPDIPELPKN